MWKFTENPWAKKNKTIRNLQRPQDIWNNQVEQWGSEHKNTHQHSEKPNLDLSPISSSLDDTKSLFDTWTNWIQNNQTPFLERQTINQRAATVVWWTSNIDNDHTLSWEEVMEKHEDVLILITNIWKQAWLDPYLKLNKWAFNTNIKSEKWTIRIEFHNWIPVRFCFPEWSYINLWTSKKWDNNSELIKRFISLLGFQFDITTLQDQRDENKSTWLDNIIYCSWPSISLKKKI